MASRAPRVYLVLLICCLLSAHAYYWFHHQEASSVMPAAVVSTLTSTTTRPIDWATRPMPKSGRPGKDGIPPWIRWSDSMFKPQFEDLDWRRPLGRVPFYMYEGDDWDKLTNVHFHCYKHTKSCAEFYFLHHLRFHPWRVMDPEKALVFVPPIMISDLLEPRTSYEAGQKALNAAFKRVGSLTRKYRSRTHLIVSGDWIVRETLDNLHWNVTRHVADNVVMVMEAMDVSSKTKHDGVRITSGGLSIRKPVELQTLSNATRAPPTASEYLQQRPLKWNMVGRADSRPAYFLRNLVYRHFPKTADPSALVLVKQKNSSALLVNLPECKPGSGPKEWHGCEFDGQFDVDLADELLRTSKYVVIVRGDDGGSQRLHQAAASGTLMVIIGAATINEGLPFHCQVPWKKIAYTFPDQSILENSDVEEKVSQVIGNDSDLSERLRLYHKHVADIVWELPNSRVPTNALLEAGRRVEPDELRRLGMSALDFGCVEGGADRLFFSFAHMEEPHDLE